ncbi:hypothetical protein ABZ837_27510 [Streptomyces sp. NPDC047197]|uniref:hypothetical protein n=1 Tax=Streptomyces sp. NPDC047197 TaxID=3155477 RepID=UPI0033C88F27
MTNVEEHVDLSAEVYACCEIPWAATTVEGNYYSVQVNTHFGNVHVLAIVAMTTMSPGTGFGEGINPRAYEGTVELFGDEKPEWIDKVKFCAPDALPPRTSVSLKFTLPDWSQLYLPDEEGQPVANPQVFEDFYECILFAINQALFSAADDGPILAGPISHGDLIGDGLVRLNPAISNEPFYVRLPATSPLGSYSSERDGHPAISAEAGLKLVHSQLSSAAPVRRLFSWMRRSVLRAHRKEWAEAIVAQQAALEDWMHHLVCGIAADHGYTSTEFASAGFEEKNAAEVFGILSSHLGGDPTAASNAQKTVWRTRNSVVHRGERATESLFLEAYNAALFLQGWSKERLLIPEVARRHPITCWILHHDDSPLAPDVRDAIEKMIQKPDVVSLPMVNDQRPLAIFPPRNLRRPSECWGKGTKVPRPF